MHSSQFKEMSQFGSGKNVLIVGSGETGMDLAYMAVNSDAKSVTLCHRDGFLCAPKVSSLTSEKRTNQTDTMSRELLSHHGSV